MDWLSHSGGQSARSQAGGTSAALFLGTETKETLSGLKGDICKDVHCSIDCGGREVAITCVSITGG